jgi:hypothetical protein
MKAQSAHHEAVFVACDGRSVGAAYRCAIWSNIEITATRLRKRAHAAWPRMVSAHRDQAQRILATDMGERFTPKIERRDFLRGFALAASTAAITPYTPAKAGNFPDTGKARYQPDSREVQTFYRVNRYPAK